jgi:signal transduction histidine kinase
MLSLLFFAYIAFIIFLITKIRHGQSNIWLCVMLAGFCSAFFGLALYMVYISSSVLYSNSEMFSNVSKYIWIINYYLNFDILGDYRIMNIGVALYIYGALCFTLSYVNNIRMRKTFYILGAVFPILIIILNDPESLSYMLGYKGMNYFSEIYAQYNMPMFNFFNLIFNYLIKLYIFLSIGTFLFVYRETIPMQRRKLVYMLFGVIPVHVLFVILFFWFPDNKIVFTRYSQLATFSLPYNKFLYETISCIAFFFIIDIIFMMWKYNIFEMNRTKNRIYFQKQLNTAQIGLKVFSHSIKNQLIAIKLLSEQLEKVEDKTRRSAILQNIETICNSSIEKLGTAFKDTSVVNLKYEYIDVNKLIGEVILKYENINPRIKFVSNFGSEFNWYLDTQLFEKVLDNIFNNAVEASEEQEIPTVKVAVQEKRYYGIITISDNGVGISKKNIKSIFDPFFSTKPMSSNWGIGLPYCQKVVEAFGGSIQIESHQGRGTAVYIYIPLTSDRPKEKPARSGASGHPKKWFRIPVKAEG